MSDDFIDSADFDPFDPVLAQKAEEAVKGKQEAYEDAVVRHLARCREAYSRVFVGGNAGKDDVDFVMRDLAWFAQIDQLFFADARMQDVYIGRKQMLQRISEYTSLDHATLVKRYIETQN